MKIPEIPQVEWHRGGKIEMRSRVAINTQQVLRDIYTPGVARVALKGSQSPLGTASPAL